MTSLEIADQLASIASAVSAAAGLVLTVVGLRLQGRRPKPESPPQVDVSSSGTTGPQLYIPDRNEWVPGPENLPRPSGPQPTYQGWGHPGSQDPNSARSVRMPTGRILLVVGLVMLALAVAGALFVLVL